MPIEVRYVKLFSCTFCPWRETERDGTGKLICVEAGKRIRNTKGFPKWCPLAKGVPKAPKEA